MRIILSHNEQYAYDLINELVQFKNFYIGFKTLELIAEDCIKQMEHHKCPSPEFYNSYSKWNSGKTDRINLFLDIFKNFTQDDEQLEKIFRKYDLSVYPTHILHLKFSYLEKLGYKSETEAFETMMKIL